MVKFKILKFSNRGTRTKGPFFFFLDENALTWWSPDIIAIILCNHEYLWVCNKISTSLLLNKKPCLLSILFLWSLRWGRWRKWVFHLIEDLLCHESFHFFYFYFFCLGGVGWRWRKWIFFEMGNGLLKTPLRLIISVLQVV